MIKYKVNVKNNNCDKSKLIEMINETICQPRYFNTTQKLLLLHELIGVDKV